MKAPSGGDSVADASACAKDYGWTSTCVIYAPRISWNSSRHLALHGFRYHAKSHLMVALDDFIAF
ncbi:MAG: hypothetical protein J6X55_01450 [Victivallales bacterium]|nr:hypothetical protein [Victivallales bacterium]